MYKYKTFEQQCIEIMRDEGWTEKMIWEKVQKLGWERHYDAPIYCIQCGRKTGNTVIPVDLDENDKEDDLIQYPLWHFIPEISSDEKKIFFNWLNGRDNVFESQGLIRLNEQEEREIHLCDDCLEMEE